MLAVEPEIVEQYVRTGKVRLVFRNVLSFGDRSERAAEAAACAGEQELFWEMHALLFQNQDEIWRTNGAGLVDLMLEYASRIENLDLEGFRECISDRRTLAGLREADEQQRRQGIIYQPIFEIGEQRLVGLQSFEQMSAAIEAASQ